MKKEGFRVAVVPITYYKSTKLERALERLFVEVDKAYKDGADILVLSDRDVDENHMAIPSLLAVSAVHQHLVATEETDLTFSDPGVGRTKGGSSLCDTARIWSVRSESVSCIGYDP